MSTTEREGFYAKLHDFLEAQQAGNGYVEAYCNEACAARATCFHGVSLAEPCPSEDCES